MTDSTPVWSRPMNTSTVNRMDADASTWATLDSVSVELAFQDYARVAEVFDVVSALDPEHQSVLPYEVVHVRTRLTAF